MSKAFIQSADAASDTVDRTRRLLLAALGGLPFAATAADAYPSKPIRLIVPVPPGGPTDSLARMLGEGMISTLNQQVIVDNRSGAGGLIGAAQAANSPPDGYTMLMAFGGIVTIAPSLYKKLPLDPLRELTPVTMLTTAPLVLVAREGGRFKSLADVLAAAGSGGPPSFGSSGNGSSMHLTGELFSRSANVRLTHVPYRGSAPALQDLLAGSVDLAISDAAFYLPQLKAGRVRGLAITGPRRHPLLQDVMTFQEGGVRGLESVTSWQGLFVPRGTPERILDRIRLAALGAIRSPALRANLVGQGYVVDTTSGEDFRRFISEDAARWGGVIRAAGIELEQ